MEIIDIMLLVDTLNIYSYLSIHGARETSNVDVLEAAISTSHEL